ncbi:low affinity immunoglobulin gamma Fc region receptor II-like isoform X2 [Amphiprion ocellaris]|uniref:low affinity immunoglobulin gamma Fc region receptor II-like isoform X2 n=1 Tax=Amphiprion ocellaris TaxID=80972 RepID=UPI002410CC11|nr:low affinity immunoglobulin gamma Fc region receptor II-like isoform X2 [Amphiprion ocellaris]
MIQPSSGGPSLVVTLGGSSATAKRRNSSLTVEELQCPRPASGHPGSVAGALGAKQEDFLCEDGSHIYIRGNKHQAAMTPSLREEVQTSDSRGVSCCWDRMQVTPLCLMLSCLRVTPDKTQFFRYDSVTLKCEDQSNSTGWKIKRRTLDGGIRLCSSGWGYTSTGSTCVIGNTYPSDSGLYWCESVTGQHSNIVNITITDRSVVLESPVLPVTEGAAMTLRCKGEANSSYRVFDFYKDGRNIRSGSTGEMTIDSVSRSDEGLYKCSASGGPESAVSWLAVEVPPSTSSAAPPAASSSISVFRIMCHLVVGTPYLLSTILLGLIYRDRKKATQTVKERRGSNDVIMEIVV